MNVDSGSVKKLSEVAAKEPTKFDAKERGEFLTSHIQQIRRMVVNRQPLEDIKASFPEFSEQYPSLLEMITRPEYDERSLSIMVSMIVRMGQHRTTQHEASIAVGKHLLDTYVTPQVTGNL